MPFVNDFEAGLLSARRTQRPLLVDFSGMNCISGADMRLRMARPEWKRRIEKFVGVRLYVDSIPHITDRDEQRRLARQNQQLQSDLLQDVVLPSYAIVDPTDQTLIATYIGAESPAHSGSFIKFLDDGWQRWEERATRSARNER